MEPPPADLVGHLGVVERGNDLGGLAVGKAPVEQAVVGARGPEGQRGEAGHQHKGGGGDADPLAGPNWLQMVRSWVRSLARFWFIQ
jgi:hypothetical protein